MEELVITRRKLIEGAAAVAGATWLARDGSAQSAKTSNAPPADKPWDVRRFGAKGDGQALDTGDGRVDALAERVEVLMAILTANDDLAVEHVAPWR